jgi:hypothetical protein
MKYKAKTDSTCDMRIIYASPSAMSPEKFLTTRGLPARLEMRISGGMLEKSVEAYFK